MSDLKRHVDHLFSGYKNNKQNTELKNEILSNLEAKVDDLTSKGIPYEDAFRAATKDIIGIEALIDDDLEVYTNKLKLEFFQSALIYSLIAWILTIPFSVVYLSVLTNYFMVLVVAIFGICFLWFNRKKETEIFEQISHYNIHS